MNIGYGGGGSRETLSYDGTYNVQDGGTGRTSTFNLEWTPIVLHGYLYARENGRFELRYGVQGTLSMVTIAAGSWIHVGHN
jgi:hypothetical protein